MIHKVIAHIRLLFTTKAVGYLINYCDYYSLILCCSYWHTTEEFSQ